MREWFVVSGLVFSVGDFQQRELLRVVCGDAWLLVMMNSKGERDVSDVERGQGNLCEKINLFLFSFL